MRESIASRELEIRHSDGSGSPVRVTLFRPVAEKVGYRCDFEIEGLETKLSRYAMGEDSMQALILALSMIGALLETSEPARRGQLSWLGMTDLGFPPLPA